MVEQLFLKGIWCKNTIGILSHNNSPAGHQPATKLFVEDLTIYKSEAYIFLTKKFGKLKPTTLSLRQFFKRSLIKKG